MARVGGMGLVESSSPTRIALTKPVNPSHVSPEVRMWTLEAIAQALTKGARTQHDSSVVGPSRPSNFDSTAGHHNVWYGNSSGGRRGEHQQQQPAVTRCDPVADSGRTRGDANTKYKCVHFARGNCVAGGDCAYLHTLPTAIDDATLSLTHDVFGRERHARAREDNGGVGSFARKARTLFVYYGGDSAGTIDGHRSKDKIQELLLSNFGEWGHVEDVHVMPTKCIAFIRFTHRTSAEFAKEAMAGQSLIDSNMKKKRKNDTPSALSVRWANDDPSAEAITRVKREREELTIDAVHRYEERLSKDQKLARDQLNNLQHGAYPDTDAQYPGGVPDCLPIEEQNAPIISTAPNIYPPPQPGLPAIDEEEIARIKAAIGIGSAVAREDDAKIKDDSDDEDEFDPDDYPTFEVEKV